MPIAKLTHHVIMSRVAWYFLTKSTRATQNSKAEIKSTGLEMS